MSLHSPPLLFSHPLQLYLLTDTDLRGLGTLERKNPQNKNWAPLKMYLLSQVRERAIEKHGSLEAIARKRGAVAAEKIDQRVKRKAEDDDRERIEQQQLDRWGELVWLVVVG